ncbi:MAG: fibronectin type III domain-containing protein [Minisyncoccia bacterium]
MKTKKLSLKSKLLIAIFILNIYFLPANSAKAVCPPTTFPAGTDICGALSQISNYITAGSAPVTAGATAAGAATNVAELTWSAVGKNLLDYAAYAAAQNLLTQLTNNTVRWIQGGFHGSPAYAVDTDQMFTEIADNIAGNLVLSIRNIATCNFSANYKDDLMNAVYLEPKKRDYVYDNKAKCPFKENYDFKASDFYSGVSRFTWDAFGDALEDGGNPYGLETITAKEMAYREAEAKQTKSQKLSWSNGYADIIDPNSCNYPAEIFYAAGDSSPDGDDVISGEAWGPLRTRVLSQAQASQKNAELLSDPARVKALQDAYCKTTTPGKIVGDQLTKSLGMDMDRIGFADNMNKIIAAFLDQLTQQTIRGVFGKGNSSYSTGPIGGGIGADIAGGGGANEVIVTTSSNTVNITSTSATIQGAVTYAGSEANVSVWFRWSNENFDRYNLSAPANVTSKPSLYTTGPYSKNAQVFSANLTGLTPNTTYYYNANAQTSQIVNNKSNVLGEILQFRTEP